MSGVVKANWNFDKLSKGIMKMIIKKLVKQMITDDMTVVVLIETNI